MMSNITRIFFFQNEAAVPSTTVTTIATAASGFYLPLLTYKHGSPFSRIVPEHLTSCSETYFCKYPCPYESGFNKYLYLDGSIFSNERLKLGEENLVVKHEIRRGGGFLEFVDRSALYQGKASPLVGKQVKVVQYKPK